ncbi:MAG: pantoate--beta-alanine ligase [Desulfovibrionaceae bacterium]
MDIIHDPKELRRRTRAWRAEGRRVALVPTMGYFHAGHLALMDRARTLADRVVVSLFVNPTQFGPTEDLDRYPRDLDHDSALAAEHGVDLLFAPEPGAMYAENHAAWIEVPALGRHLCGAQRPIHFRGVCTVVAKLFHLTAADVAVFGQKDWQQLAILRRMVRDLDFDVELVGQPIVREADGLALSSRNVFLDPEERAQAPEIHAGLEKLRAMAAAGQADSAVLLAAFREHLAERLPLGRIDYAEIVDCDDIVPVPRIKGRALAAVAVQLRRARLIDNMVLEV